MAHSLRGALGAAALGIALILSGCTGANGGDNDASAHRGSSNEAFPVTVEHAHGATEIPDKPDRIVALDALSLDQLLSLGIAPLTTGDQPWSGDEDGLNPWPREALEQLDAELPEVIPMLDTGEYDYEEILSFAPDLILAQELSVDDVVFARLSEIAPTVAYQSKSSGMDGWREQMRIVGTAVGESDKAQAVVADAEATFAKIQQDHPEFAGKTFFHSRGIGDGDTMISPYVAGARGVEFIASLGLTNAPIAEELAEDALREVGYAGAGVSLEEMDRLDADVWVVWFIGEQDRNYTMNHPIIKAWQQQHDVTIVEFTDPALVQAMTFSSPLSIQWGAEGLAERISQALA